MSGSQRKLRYNKPLPKAPTRRLPPNPPNKNNRNRNRSHTFSNAPPNLNELAKYKSVPSQIKTTNTTRNNNIYRASTTTAAWTSTTNSQPTPRRRIMTYTQTPTPNLNYKGGSQTTPSSPTFAHSNYRFSTNNHNGGSHTTPSSPTFHSFKYPNPSSPKSPSFSSYQNGGSQTSPSTPINYRNTVNIKMSSTRNRSQTLPNSPATSTSRRSSYHKMLPLNHDIVNEAMNYSFNDRVDLNDNRQGTIRFIGEISVHLNGAIWYGIELNKEQGTNNGTLRGVQYFKCQQNFGTFVEKKTIRWLTSDEKCFDSLDSINRFHINQIVKIRGKRGRAQIRFIGLFLGKLKYGVELLDDMGAHSGSIGGKFYFTCGILRGLFVEKERLIRLDNKPKTGQHKLTESNLPSYHPRDEDGDDDSDDSMESMASIGSVQSNMSVTEVDDDVFERIQLNENETDMAFTQILNKCMLICMCCVCTVVI